MPSTSSWGQPPAQMMKEEFHVRSVARVQVKGKMEPVEIATLIAARDAEIDPEYLRQLETYEAAFQKFRQRDFRETRALLTKFLEHYPRDFLARLYLEKAVEYEEAPPGEDWNAVEVFKKK